MNDFDRIEQAIDHIEVNPDEWISAVYITSHYQTPQCCVIGRSAMLKGMTRQDVYAMFAQYDTLLDIDPLIEQELIQANDSADTPAEALRRLRALVAVMKEDGLWESDK